MVAQESPDNKANIMAAITLLLLQEETSTNIETVGQQVPIVLGADLQGPYVVSGDAFSSLSYSLMLLKYALICRLNQQCYLKASKWKPMALEKK